MKEIMKNRIASTKQNKKQHVLFLFLIISSFFWLLTKLSNEYVTNVVYNIEYVNLPAAKLFQNTPDPSLELRLKATGFKLLGENINTKTLTIDLQNVRYSKGYKYFILSRTKQNELQKQLDKNIKLETINKDSLFFELGINKFKKVPVIADVDVRFKSGFNFSDKISISPDSIEIRGPEIQINKIDALKFKKLKLQDVAEDIYYEVQLELPENLDKVHYSEKAIKVVARVEKFTEGSFHIPFEIVGIPEDAKVTTYPKSVEIIFQVGISNYNKISADDFKVTCDYLFSKKNNHDYLTPVLVKKPSLVSSIKMSPDHIEYLIQK